MLKFVIRETEDNQTLVSFLKKRFKTTPLSLIYKLFRTKKVKVNSQNVRYYHYRLKLGEEVTIFDSSLKIHKQNSSKLPEKSQKEAEVVYEDKNIIIVLKEHGISMPDLDKEVKYYLYQQNSQQYQDLVQNYFSFTAIHRLDKLTKGLVIYSKNATAKRILHNAIGDKEKITKKYLAVCENSAKKILPNFISGYLWKNEKEKKMEFSLNCKKENAKQCAMEMKEINNKNKQQRLLEITLITGRKHQIRSILSFFNSPIVGDKKYGSKIEANNKIYLFAYQIKFNNLLIPLTYLNEKTFQMKEIGKTF